MGRKGFRGGRKGAPRRDGGGGGSGGGGRGPSYKSWPDIVKKHEKLERYYDTILPFDDAERAEFWEALKRELPNSFRFCGSKGHALAVRRLLETRYSPEISAIEQYEGQKVDPPQAVPWYPDQLAYSMTTPKHVIRKFPPFAAFQKFLVSETSVGNISRQEVVSMIPPLLLDVEPGMAVLDMCAAPGSKATQLLEMLHVGEEARMRKFMQSFGKTKSESDVNMDVDLNVDAGDDGRATGLLIANDAEHKRCHMLTHQLKRLSSPNLIVTNHDATFYPAIKLGQDPANPKKNQYLKFDRILADVPCSGDGTMRKNVTLWNDWQPSSALGLHLTQTRILVRALQLLKPGGRVVYSTCSMNPVECEAAVLSAIERCGGPSKIDIIDCKDRLPLLKRYPGMHQWQVMDKQGKIWSSWEEVQQHITTGGEAPPKISETMFPRPDISDCSSLPLDRCMRVYAHQQDTGGFFITVLEKKADFTTVPEGGPKTPVTNDVASSDNLAKAEPEEVATKMEVEEQKAAAGQPTDVLPTIGTKRNVDDEEPEGKPESKRQKTETPPKDDKNNAKTEADNEPDVAVSKDGTESTPQPKAQADRPVKGNQGEDPFKFLPSDHEVIENIRAFYQLSPQFPKDRFMVRNAMGEPAKTIYYTSALARSILVENEGRGIKFVHGGVKMFMKQDAPSAEICRWRIQSEGMPIINAYVSDERVVRLTDKNTFRTLLKEMFPKFVNEDWKRLGEIGERARDIGMGCCILRIEPDGSDPDFAEQMVLPLWKSVQSLNLMLPKEDRSAMLLRIFNDTSPVVNLSLKKAAEKEADAAGAADPEAKEEILEDAATIENGADSTTEVKEEQDAKGAKGGEDEVNTTAAETIAE
ncbi:S-adenosyl-L-methionine-dependent methyltransferase [Xylariomycetidae sp. FL2044]|nr:S-adenosyl-L-methionine-dependent methyltransferase [Xylariomycetidae sp. FL2044]